MYKPEGVVGSLVTPFDKNGNIMEEGFRELISYQMNAGVHGIGIVPNTGEFINLTMDDIKRLVDITVDEVKGRLPITVGALSPSMRFNIEIAEYSKKVGADAILVGPPYYLAPAGDGLVDYFRQIGAVGIPMVIFNHPYKTPFNIMPDMLEKLFEIPTFVGIKEVDASMTRNVRRLAFIDNRISYLMGEEDLAFYHFILGGHGGFFALSNIVPGMLVSLYEESKAGNLAKARKLHMDLSTLSEVVYVENYPAAIKEALNMMGLKGGYTRAPIGGLTEASKENLARVLTKLNLI
jgi:4-hydroxy-tetrahydrodipicolinate synthase